MHFTFCGMNTIWISTESSGTAMAVGAIIRAKRKWTRQRGFERQGKGRYGERPGNSAEKMRAKAASCSTINFAV